MGSIQDEGRTSWGDFAWAQLTSFSHATLKYMLPILAGVLGTLSSVIWLSFPNLQPWSLQAGAVLVLLYIASIRLSGKRWAQFLPPAAGLQSVFLTSAAGIIVGSTGGVNSPFFFFLPLTIFFCTLTLPLQAVVVQSLGLTIILWMGLPQKIMLIDWTHLLLLPAMLPVAFLARQEMDASKHRQHAEFLAHQKREKQAEEAVIFLGTLVGPKISSIQTFLQQSPENRIPAAKQLETLATEIRGYAHELESSAETPSPDINAQTDIDQRPQA